nr:MAG: putative zinc- or iron-chelating domain protein [uncultured archaeon]
MPKNLCEICKGNIKKYCCYNSIIVIGESGKKYNIIIKTKPCKFLDTETLKCLVYKNRFKLNPYCLSIKEAKRQFALQKECLYVRDDESYKGGITKIDYIPDDVPKHILLKLQTMEQMRPEEFRRMFLPLIL